MKKLILIQIILFFFTFNFINLYAQDWIKQSPIPTPNTPYDIYCADSNTIIISCQEGIFKTNNRGLSWIESTKESSNPVIEFCFVNDQVGWGAGDDLTIHKTNDGGDTWVILKEELDTSDLNSICFVDLNKGWAVGEEGAILCTDDGGETWNKQVSNTLKNLKAVHFADSLNGYCIGTDIALKTNNGGAIWDSITNITGLSKSEDVYCFNSDTCIIVAENSPGSEVHRTTDGGANWTTQSFSSGWLKELDFINTMYGYMIGRCAYGTYHCDTWGFCSWSDYDMAIWKTEDGGISWDRTIFSNTSDFLYDVSIADNNIICASGTGGFIIQTLNNGDAWCQILKGTLKSLHSSQFINSQLGYAVGNDGVIMATSDAGDNWIRQSSGTSNDLFSIQFINSNTGWVVGEYGRVRKTVNNGVTWSSQTSGVNSNLYSVFFIDSLTGYIAGDYGTILKTINSGSNWIAQTSGVTRDLYDIFFIDDLTGWAIGYYGTILNTTNGGDTWSAQTSNTTSTLYSIFFKDTQEGWAVGSGGKFLHTTNGGEAWEILNSGTTNDLKFIYFLNSENGWVVGSDIILRTTNRGESWELSYSANSFSLNSVYFTDIDTGWVFGDDGIILKTTTGGGEYYTIPKLLEPENNSINISTNTTLYWTSIEDALSYNLQVSKYSSFSSTIIDESGITDTSYSVSGLDENRKYYWRVCAVYEDELNIWSNSYNFRTCEDPPSAPTLSSPNNGAEDLTRIPTLKWYYMSGVDTYHLQVSESNDFSSLTFEDSTILGYITSYEISLLDELTTYYWRVRAKNTGGYSPYSEVYSFTTSLHIINPPSAPNLYSPYNGEEYQPLILELDWSNTSNTDVYHLQVSKNNSFTEIVFNDSTITESSQIIGTLESMTMYYWRVRAKNAGGYSPYSEINYFITENSDLFSQAGYCINSLYFIDNNTGWASGYNGTIVKTVNGGTTWNELISGTTETFKDIFFINSLTGWAVGNNGTIIKTIDGGDIWEIHNSETTYDLESVSFVNTTIGWVVGHNGIILKTTDGGTSWIMQNSDDLLLLETVYFINENIGWAAGYDILRTNDGGTTWSYCTPEDWWGISRSSYFIDDQEGWIVGFDGEILKTINGGTTWSNQVSGTTEILNDVFFYDKYLGWAVGNEGTVIKTTNGGINWVSLETGTSDILKSVYFVNQDTGWVGGICTILKTETGIGEVASLSLPQLISPANNSTEIPVDITLNWEPVQSANSYQLQISNTTDFNSPIYDQSNIITTSQQVDSLDNNTTYYWRVNASDDEGTISPWSDVWEFTTISSVGIEEFSSITQYKLYPNPVNNTLFFEGFENEQTNISILSIEGKLLIQINEKGINKIDVSDLQNGIYLIKIVTLEIIIIKKIVKQ